MNEQLSTEYGAKVRATAIEVIGANVTGWEHEEIAAAADLFIRDRGFGHGSGLTYRTAANTLRKVKPDLPFAEAKPVAGALNRADRELTGTPHFDKLPHRCIHCGDRFALAVHPRTHYGHHETIFDPRTF